MGSEMCIRDRLRQHPPITTLVGILSAGRLHLGVGGRVLLVVICIRDDAAGQVALRGGQADPRPFAGHQNRKSVFPEFSEALGGPVVEVDVAGIVRSGEAPVKEAPRSWSPNSPYFNGRSQLLRDALLDALLCSDSALTHTGAQPP